MPGFEAAAEKAKDAYNKDIAAQHNFNLKVKFRSQASGILQLQFRSARSNIIDMDVPQASPHSVVENAAILKRTESMPYYHVMIVSNNPSAVVSASPTASEKGGTTGTINRAPKSPLNVASGSVRSSMDNIVSGASNCTSGNSLRLFTLVDEGVAAFDGIVLGPMLGHGSFGRVYRGECKP